MENTEEQVSKRVNTDSRLVKIGQEELNLKAFFSKYVLECDFIDHPIDVDSLRYSYMKLARYPAFGNWEFLMK